MKNRKLIRDSFYVNSESFSGTTINSLDQDLFYHYNKNGKWKLSIKDSEGNVIQVPGIIYPISAITYTPITTTWSLSSTQLILPFVSSNGSQFDCEIDWGDGNIETITNTTAIHNYASSGLKTVTISGTCEGWDFSVVTSNNDEILTISGGDNHKFKYLTNAFHYCSSLLSVDIPNWDVSEVTDLSFLFNYCSSLTYINISNWDTSNVINMEGMFNYIAVTTLDLTNLDVSNVVNMDVMFAYIETLTTLYADWTTTNLVTTQSMFEACSSLSTIDVSSWITGTLIENMDGMFNTCSSLTTLDVSNWNVSSVIIMANMFISCSLTTLDVSNWNTSNVEDMSYMFLDCNVTSEMPASVFWDNANVTNHVGCFQNATNISNYNDIPNNWKGL